MDSGEIIVRREIHQMEEGVFKRVSLFSAAKHRVGEGVFIWSVKFSPRINLQRERVVDNTCFLLFWKHRKTWNKCFFFFLFFKERDL